MPETTIEIKAIELMMDTHAKNIAIAVVMFSNGIDWKEAEKIYRQFLKKVNKK